MKTLVTGGSGFLGSHVADALSEAGHQVTVFDINPSPYLRSDQTMVTGDIQDAALIEDLAKSHDYIYHFAGIADIDECIRRPIDTVTINIEGTVRLLDAAARSGVKRFVFASSAYVFSEAGYFYRASKQACESYLEIYHELFGLEYTSLRYGSLYGERADDRNSIHRLLKQALTTGKILYEGSGEEIREFIHVYDAAQASVQILSPEYANEHLILTGSQAMRYKDLLDMIHEILNKRVEVEIRPSHRKAHYKITPYNFSPRLGKKFVANPHVDMGQGLLHCLAALYRELHVESIESPGLFLEEGKS